MRDQNGFAGQRDELCRDYAKESLHGYCALRVTEARTALLQTRLDELGPATASKAASEKGKKAKSKKGKQPKRRLDDAERRSLRCSRTAHG